MNKLWCCSKSWRQKSTLATSSRLSSKGLTHTCSSFQQDWETPPTGHLRCLMMATTRVLLVIMLMFNAWPVYSAWLVYKAQHTALHLRALHCIAWQGPIVLKYCYCCSCCYLIFSARRRYPNPVWRHLQVDDMQKLDAVWSRHHSCAGQGFRVTVYTVNTRTWSKLSRHTC